MSLTESQSRVHTASGPTSSNGSATVSSTQSTLTSSAPNSSALRPQESRSPRGIGASGETNLQVIPTPTSSKSPRSPRSLFNQSYTSKKTETRQVQTSNAQSLPQLQSRFSSQQTSEYPQFDYKAGPVAESYDQDYYHYPPDPRANPSEPQAAQPPPRDQKNLSSSRSQNNLRTGPTTPTLRDGAGAFQILQNQPTPQQPSGCEGEKHTRSASRFFNFKSSKTPQHRREQTRKPLPTQGPSQNPRSNNENGGAESVSRGAEQRLDSERTASKASKYSGMSALLDRVKHCCVTHVCHFAFRSHFC